MTILVLSALMLSSLVSHHFSIVLMVFYVRCQMTSVSLPSASVTRSSANAWRYPGISFAENLSRSSLYKVPQKWRRNVPLGITSLSSPDSDPLSYVFVSYCEVTVVDHVDNPSCGGFVNR